MGRGSHRACRQSLIQPRLRCRCGGNVRADCGALLPARQRLWYDLIPAALELWRGGQSLRAVPEHVARHGMWVGGGRAWRGCWGPTLARHHRQPLDRSVWWAARSLVVRTPAAPNGGRAGVPRPQSGCHLWGDRTPFPPVSLPSLRSESGRAHGRCIEDASSERQRPPSTPTDSASPMICLHTLSLPKHCVDSAHARLLS